MDVTHSKLNRAHRIGLLTVFAVIVLIVVLMLAGFMKKSVDSTVYEERKVFLKHISDTSADVINDNITYVQSSVDMITDNAERDISHYSNLRGYINDMCRQAGYKDRMFFFVDKNGRYYSSDGESGKITDRTYFTDTSDNSISYISTLPHLTPEKEYLIFRNRMYPAVTVLTESGESEIVYCGVLYDLDDLNSMLVKEFEGESNTFIYDNTNGVMLYKNFDIGLLISGYNIYPKLYRADMMFGEKSEKLEQACRNGETVTVAMNIDGSEYYFCSSPLMYNNWSVAFVLQSEYMNSVSGNSISKITLFVTAIAVILGVSVVFLAIYIYRNRLSQKSIETMKKLNAELDNATRAKSDFLSNMSHDIRTPINGIMGMTAIARGVEGNPEKTKVCLDKIDGASRHLLSLINDVLDMSRIERGAVKIADKPIDLRVVCDNCTSIIMGQLSDRNIDFITQFDCLHPQVLGDDLHLRQILINILSNAVKFTHDGGTIRFSCHESDTTETSFNCVFEIEDTGVGMKPEFLNRIFDAFSQDEAGARSEYKGTGLGMAITKQLTELMNGTISVESEIEKGSRFTVSIPCVINTQSDAVENFYNGSADISGIKLLLVEDNELNLEIATELLEEAGAKISSAANGQQGVEAFRDNPPGTFDLILMDVMMPVMNGLDAAKAIRSLDRDDARTIPIIAMTANAFESDIQATMEAGMNEHVSKPIDINILTGTIEYHLRKQRTGG